MDQIPQKPRFALVGSGALGCYYGGRLVEHGHEVHFLMRSDYEHVRQHGMIVQSHAGDFEIPPERLNVYQKSSDMPQCDVVLVTLKTTANRYYRELIAPLLHENTVILTLQNGLGNEQRLADLFGEDRIIGGLAFVCINRTAPGRILHTEYGLIKIGEYKRPVSPRLRRICEIFNASKVPCQMLENLAAGRWEKLVWNVPFNGLGAALQLATDRIVNNPQGVELVRNIMHEIVAIARAEGVELPEDVIEQNIRKTQTMGAYRSSMQIDQEMGRPIELESIIAAPLATAHRHRISAPYLLMLYQLLCIVAPNQP